MPSYILYQVCLACYLSFLFVACIIIKIIGTGKSVTGAHIAFALAMRLKKEISAGETGNKCVMYCGPSQQSVNVVLGMCINYT